MGGKLLQPEYQDRQQLVIIFQTTTVENGQNPARKSGRKTEQAWHRLWIQIFSERGSAGSKALPE